MGRPAQLDRRGADRADRGGVLNGPLDAWLAAALGRAPGRLALYERALTHGSVAGGADYQRLEFLGDRVLGLAVARLLYEATGEEAEGALSKRQAALVAGATCAEVGRAIGVGPHVKLGKQARDDGARESDNVLGDVVEALIGALFLDHGLEAADAFVRRHWQPRLAAEAAVPQHPKSALQEWAAAHRRKPPEYRVVGRSGPGHAPRFTIAVAIHGAGEAEAEGSNKQEAQTAAAAALLERLNR